MTSSLALENDPEDQPKSVPIPLQQEDEVASAIIAWLHRRFDKKPKPICPEDLHPIVDLLPDEIEIISAAGLPTDPVDLHRLLFPPDGSSTLWQRVRMSDHDLIEDSDGNIWIISREEGLSDITRARISSSAPSVMPDIDPNEGPTQEEIDGIIVRNAAMICCLSSNGQRPHAAWQRGHTSAGRGMLGGLMGMYAGEARLPPSNWELYVEPLPGGFRCCVLEPQRGIWRGPGLIALDWNEHLRKFRILAFTGLFGDSAFRDITGNPAMQALARLLFAEIRQVINEAGNAA